MAMAHHRTEERRHFGTRDVSVAGFDDIEYSVIFDPPLTTMHQPGPRSAAGGARTSRQINRDARGAPSRVRLDCELVIRESTQPQRLSVDAASANGEKRQVGVEPRTRARKIAASL